MIAVSLANSSSQKNDLDSTCSSILDEIGYDDDQENEEGTTFKKKQLVKPTPQKENFVPLQKSLQVAIMNDQFQDANKKSEEKDKNGSSAKEKQVVKQPKKLSGESQKSLQIAITNDYFRDNESADSTSDTDASLDLSSDEESKSVDQDRVYTEKEKADISNIDAEKILDHLRREIFNSSTNHDDNLAKKPKGDVSPTKKTSPKREEVVEEQTSHAKEFRRKRNFSCIVKQKKPFDNRNDVFPKQKTSKFSSFAPYQTKRTKSMVEHQRQHTSDFKKNPLVVVKAAKKQSPLSFESVLFVNRTMSNDIQTLQSLGYQLFDHEEVFRKATNILVTATVLRPDKGKSFALQRDIFNSLCALFGPYAMLLQFYRWSIEFQKNNSHDQGVKIALLYDPVCETTRFSEHVLVEYGAQYYPNLKLGTIFVWHDNPFSRFKLWRSLDIEVHAFGNSVSPLANQALNRAMLKTPLPKDGWPYYDLDGNVVFIAVGCHQYNIASWCHARGMRVVNDAVCFEQAAQHLLHAFFLDWATTTREQCGIPSFFLVPNFERHNIQRFATLIKKNISLLQIDQEPSLLWRRIHVLLNNRDHGIGNVVVCGLSPHDPEIRKLQQCGALTICTENSLDDPTFVVDHVLNNSEDVNRLLQKCPKFFNM